MKLNNILSDASVMLGISEDDVTNQKILFRCANLVVANVTGNYIDCVTTQDFNVTEGCINYDEFDKTFLKIVSVSCSYDLYMDHIAVRNGHVTVKYAYVPEFKSPDDVVAVMNPSTLLWGILAEYACISGLVEEAKLYNDKFEKLLFASRPTGKSRRMP